MESTSAADSLPRMTAEEYFAFEEASHDKHEFHAGEVLAMSGAMPRHVRIAGRLYRALGSRLDGTPCEPYTSDLRVAVDEADRYLYPDVSVFCGPLGFGPGDKNQVAPNNPRVVFEVSSPSTDLYDRREKFDLYGRIPTLEEYVLVSQDLPHVQSLLRQGDGTWNLAVTAGLDAVLKVRSLDLQIPLAEVYPPEEPADGQG